MSIAEKLTTIAENQQKVYDAGMKAEWSAFWDVIQQFGNRRNYYGLFRFWQTDYIRPKYKVQDTISRVDSFFQSSLVKKIEAAYFDFTNAVVDKNGYYAMFNSCLNLEELEDLKIQAKDTSYTGMFYGCSALRKIAAFRVSAGSIFNITFAACPALEEVTFYGTVGQSGLDMSSSTKLTHESLMSIINALETKTSGTWTVTFGTTNLAKLTDAEKAIATEKGWTLT